METLGAYLKSKREALNISLQEISQVTRIRRSILEALEENRYDLMPPKVFAQGFIKSYASYLGLDESDIIKRYSDLLEEPETDEKTIKGSKSSSTSRVFFLFMLVVGAGLLLAAAFQLWVNPRGTGDTEILSPQQQDLITTSVVITPPSPEETTEGDAGQDTDQDPADSSPGGKVEEDNKAAGIVEQQPAEQVEQQPPAAAVDQQPAVQQPAGSETAPLVLKIVASQRTWMRIQSDKNRPVEFLLHSGGTRTVRAVEKFAIKIGNAGGVELFLNEQELGRPGKPGEVLVLTLPE